MAKYKKHIRPAGRQQIDRTINADHCEVLAALDNNRLRSFRNFLQLSQKEMSEKVGVSAIFWGMVELSFYPLSRTFLNKVNRKYPGAKAYVTESDNYLQAVKIDRATMRKMFTKGTLKEVQKRAGVSRSTMSRFFTENTKNEKIELAALEVLQEICKKK